MLAAEYFAKNVPLFSLVLIVMFLSIRNFKVRKKESIHFLVFTGIVLVLSVVVEIENYSLMCNLPILATVFTSLGYILRPILIYIFVLIANMDQKRSALFYRLCPIPLMVGAIVYSFPLFFGVPGLSTVVFSYQFNSLGQLEFVRGGVLNFFSHAISVFYLGLLYYISTFRFQGKHRRDGLIIVLCVICILAAVITEIVMSRSDLLNIICMICALVNHIFILTVNSSRDPLTKLYDRGTFNKDVSRFKNTISGVVQIDMNELKYLNDNFGHEAGDVALATLAGIFEECTPSSMCPYRVSGDEFVILMFRGKIEQLEKVVNHIKEEVSKTEYSVAIGYYYIDHKSDITFEEAYKKAEEYMYIDKDNFYKTSGKNRR